jgi:hypothetical protein
VAETPHLTPGPASLAGISRADCYVSHTHSIGFAHPALVGLPTPVFETLVAQFAPVAAMDHNYAPMSEIFREVIARTLKSAARTS